MESHTQDIPTIICMFILYITLIIFIYEIIITNPSDNLIRYVSVIKKEHKHEIYKYLDSFTEKEEKTKETISKFQKIKN